MDKPGNSAQANDWRDKYLSALDAQETMEKQLAQQQALFRRALVRVSLSADGQDPELDSALAFLRDNLRSGSGADLTEVITKVDSALSGFEQHREQTSQEIAQALSDTLNPLQKLSLSRPLSKEIRHYLSQLPQRTQKVRLYPALLQQLAEIQRRALAELQTPPAGLLQKLLGKPMVRVQDEAGEDNLDVDKETRPASESVEESAQLPKASQPVAADKSSAEPLVAGISQLLADLLRDIDVPEAIAPQVEELQARLARGLQSDEVIPTLAAVRDLIMEAYLFANKAFATYLNNVNQELSDIYGVIGGVVEHNASRVETAHELQHSMIQQMTHLETGVSDATDLDQLKNMVKSQIGNIRQALHHFQQSEQDQQQLSTQLQELAEKIKTMEADAEKNRTTLERHRYKSLHDPLTELPNREAYSERIRAEFHRWQRYQHPLSLAMCDLDYFKRINDSFGHQAGDRVLKVISRSIAKRLREVDFFGRYGGEEFVVILPETNLDAAHQLLEKIRAAIAGTAFNYKEEPLVITLSMGITQFREGDTIETAFVRADNALYAAKANGRNRCQVD